MDVRMPGVDGIEATRRIAASGSSARIVILTTYDVDEYVFSALRAGASGFLLKDVRPPELTEAIRIVARGDALLAPGVTRRLLDRFAGVLPDDGARPADLDELTDREVEVLRFVALALSNAEIADAARADRGHGEDARLLGAAEAGRCATACRRWCSRTTSGSCGRAHPEVGAERPCSRPMSGAASRT